MISKARNVNPLFALALLALAGATQAQAPVPGKGNSASGPAPEAGADAATPEQWFNAMDKDHNKALSVEEFKAGLAERNKMIVFQRMQMAFKAADKNSSGFLEATEFNALPLLKNTGANAPKLAQVDESKDGKVDFREYVGMIGKLIATRR